MASNEELIESIKVESEKRALDIPETKDLTNKQLIEILSSVKKLQLPPGPPGAGADDAAEAKANAEAVKIEAAKNAKRPPFYVVDGKSVTTKKGICSNGDEVKAEYFADQNALAELVKSGIVAKGK